MSCGWVVERWFESGNPAQWFRNDDFGRCLELGGSRASYPPILVLGENILAPSPGVLDRIESRES
jgi:hypothetical protein